MYQTIEDIATQVLLTGMPEAVKRDAAQLTPDQIISLATILAPKLAIQYKLNDPNNPLVDPASPSYAGDVYTISLKVCQQIHRMLTGY